MSYEEQYRRVQTSDEHVARWMLDTPDRVTEFDRALANMILIGTLSRLGTSVQLRIRKYTNMMEGLEGWL